MERQRIEEEERGKAKLETRKPKREHSVTNLEDVYLRSKGPE